MNAILTFKKETIQSSSNASESMNDAPQGFTVTPEPRIARDHRQPVTTITSTFTLG
jgi:hypothetical protein